MLTFPIHTGVLHLEMELFGITTSRTNNVTGVATKIRVGFLRSPVVLHSVLAALTQSWRGYCVEVSAVDAIALPGAGNFSTNIGQGRSDSQGHRVVYEHCNFPAIA